MKTSIPIHINVNEQSVSGLITYRTINDLEVSYTSPSGIMKKVCRHIPYFELPVHNYSTDYGIERAEQLLLACIKTAKLS